MTPRAIGSFEHLVLLAILRLGADAYGVPIIEELRSRTGRAVLRPAVYVALRRLEDRELVTSREEAPDPSRGGRPRRYFDLTPAGVEAVREARTELLAMWDGLRPFLDGS